MKLRTVPLVFALVFIFSVSSFIPSALAGTLQNLNTERIDVREKLQNRFEELKQKREAQIENRNEVRDKIATKEAQLQQQRINNIKNVFEKILSRYEAALTRFDQIIVRIDSRINKLKEKGVDTSAAENALTQSKTQLDKAVEAVAQAKVQVESIDPQTSNRNAVQQAVAAVQSAKKEIIKVYQSLAKTVSLLKASDNLREATGSAKGEK